MRTKTVVGKESRSDALERYDEDGDPVQEVGTVGAELTVALAASSHERRDFVDYPLRSMSEMRRRWVIDVDRPSQIFQSGA